jgi:hypothetical protein
MTGRERPVTSDLGSPGPAPEVNKARQLRALVPPMTPRVVFRLILGVLLFFCGIVLGVWLIFRLRGRMKL